jgi:hypothetical protein
VGAGWRRLHDEKLRNLYASQNIIRVIKSRSVRWARYIARMGEMRNAYKILFRKREGKRPIGRHDLGHSNEHSGSIKSG